MDKDGILHVLEILEVDKIRTFSSNVMCACFLADFRSGHSSWSDHADSMGISINPEGISLVNCFACGYKGTLAQAVSSLGRHEEKDYSALIKQIGKLEELDPETVAASVGDYDDSEAKLEETVLDESVLESWIPGAHQSIIDRGLTKETLRAWDTRWDAELKRVVVPMRRSGDNALVGAVGRTVIDHPVTYYNYWNFSKALYLCGEHMPKRGPEGIVVEGLLDTLAVWQAVKEEELDSYYAVVGLLGSSASEYQVRKLVRFFDEIVLFLDNDTAGWTGQRKLAKALQKRTIVKGIRYPERIGGDPADLMASGYKIEELIKKADLLVV